MDGMHMVLRNVTLTPEQENQIIERMVKVMVKIIEDQDDCLPHELLDQNFTIEEINRYWAKAKPLAVFEARVSKR